MSQKVAITAGFTEDMSLLLTFATRTKPKKQPQLPLAETTLPAPRREVQAGLPVDEHMY